MLKVESLETLEEIHTLMLRVSTDYKKKNVKIGYYIKILQNWWKSLRKAK